MKRRCADHSAGPRAPTAGVRGRARGGPAEAGFTLLELLVSLGIVAILIIAQVAPFRRAIDARDRAESTMQRTGAIRVTLQRIGEELAKSGQVGIASRLEAPARQAPAASETGPSAVVASAQPQIRPEVPQNTETDAEAARWAASTQPSTDRS